MGVGGPAIGEAFGAVAMSLGLSTRGASTAQPREWKRAVSHSMEPLHDHEDQGRALLCCPALPCPARAGHGFVVPGCDSCGGTLKPHVVFFGDNIPKVGGSAT